MVAFYYPRLSTRTLWHLVSPGPNVARPSPRMILICPHRRQRDLGHIWRGHLLTLCLLCPCSRGRTRIRPSGPQVASHDTTRLPETRAYRRRRSTIRYGTRMKSSKPRYTTPRHPLLDPALASPQHRFLNGQNMALLVWDIDRLVPARLSLSCPPGTPPRSIH
ncbi:hypothetical protein F5X68DRAFT_197190 [Plectosphaerella plurivora]|uniref:Uncharacterized protein n=1 Tax=Plectosphaerella plurivora TaxID=936078 RepID=A0A9P8VKQ4_9PEZI|nr:hypothetical protein F5X68DRAFT_197190 [Plectosphaerella plurivora]